MSMEKTFASLLRHSKLASYDRRLNQVYATPKQRKQHGNWGLKRNLPTVIRTSYVTIGDLDTVEHQTPWESGHSQVAFLQRWKENFGKIPTRQRLQQQQSQHDYFNIASLTRSQFNHFIKHTITPEKVHAFQQALRTNQITRDQVYDYLNVSFRPEPSRVVGPIYGTNLTQPSTIDNNDIIVEGRILNAQKGGYAVGIGGIVALLPKRYAVGLKKTGDRLLVRKFYVRRAYLDDQGKPQVIVSLQPKPETPPPSKHNVDIHLTLSSPTSALPSSLSNNKRPHWTTTLGDLFATSPTSDSIDDLQLFLLGQDNLGRTKRTPRSAISSQPNPISPVATSPSSSTTSPPLDQQHNQHNNTKDELQQDHAVIMNRIITLLKNGTPNNQ